MFTWDTKRDKWETKLLVNELTNQVTTTTGIYSSVLLKEKVLFQICGK